MITFFKMKKNEWKVKAALYGIIAGIMDNQSEILDLMQKLYVTLKDVPADDLQQAFVSELADMIHNEDKKG